jgi:hypothetical protein
VFPVLSASFLFFLAHARSRTFASHTTFVRVSLCSTTPRDKDKRSSLLRLMYRKRTPFLPAYQAPTSSWSSPALALSSFLLFSAQRSSRWRRVRRRIATGSTPSSFTSLFTASTSISFTPDDVVLPFTVDGGVAEDEEGFSTGNLAEGVLEDGLAKEEEEALKPWKGRTMRGKREREGEEETMAGERVRRDLRGSGG